VLKKLTPQKSRLLLKPSVIVRSHLGPPCQRWVYDNTIEGMRGPFRLSHFKTTSCTRSKCHSSISPTRANGCCRGRRDVSPQQFVLREPDFRVLARAPDAT